MQQRVELLLRECTSKEVLHQALDYEQRFGITFAAFAYYPGTLLKALQATPKNKKTAGFNSIDLKISNQPRNTLDELSKIANTREIATLDRERYLQIFLDVYKGMPFEKTSVTPSLVIAPRREGMLLARELGWLSSTAFTPHLKRIPIQGNLSIGVEFLPNREQQHCCRIVDGAIASGATTITLMEMFCDIAEKFEVYTVHCTHESINAMFRYARILQKELFVHAGFVGGVLNSKYYAVRDDDASTVLVGDVGDIIAPIFASNE